MRAGVTYPAALGSTSPVRSLYMSQVLQSGSKQGTKSIITQGKPRGGNRSLNQGEGVEDGSGREAVLTTGIPVNGPGEEIRSTGMPSLGM